MHTIFWLEFHFDSRKKVEGKIKIPFFVFSLFFAKVLELFGKFEAEIHIQSSLDYSTSADSFSY